MLKLGKGFAHSARERSSSWLFSLLHLATSGMLVANQWCSCHIDSTAVWGTSESEGLYIKNDSKHKQILYNAWCHKTYLWGDKKSMYADLIRCANLFRINFLRLSLTMIHLLCSKAKLSNAMLNCLRLRGNPNPSTGNCYARQGKFSVKNKLHRKPDCDHAASGLYPSFHGYRVEIWSWHKNGASEIILIKLMTLSSQRKNLTKYRTKL